ncbi:DUF349 domain-containing protein [Massilia cavernae]|uniref:DUF349 domain-containing protein n=1 Tax=Massilia cavernae TaxID=2320864 RepID=A0A418XW39_9BURK|nr:DUF349 domain-containing protein [Massilia cavernae]RJG17025.1 DUF349 domain-containing protein [Massilia cavernae]
MFEFLFKRSGDKPGAAAAGQPGRQDTADQQGAGEPSARDLQAGLIPSLEGDELAAAEFVLKSEFSELRLAAAEFIHSREQLERVHGAIRNTDRRVAKLMQSRLDAIRHRQSELERARACIALAEALAADDKLTPNQVAELDRRWSVISAPELVEEFTHVRGRLAGRMEGQVALQRAMIDRLGALRHLEGSGLAAAEVAARIEHLSQEQAVALAAPEAGTLPRSLVNEFDLERTRILNSLAALEKGEAVAAAREAALAEWEAAPRESLNAERIRKAWQHLGVATGAAPAGQQQHFDALVAALPQAPPQAARKPKAQPPAASAVLAGTATQFADTLAAMEAALEHGSLGAAADFDKVLKETRGIRLTPEQAERLAHARAELKRLSDWARWGGNVSREELIKAVEQLPSLHLAMGELAKKVGSMRDRWKALDSLSGAAPKTLWERFDAACSTAYAPAAAHFKHLAGERHANAGKAQALVAEAVAEAGRLDNASGADWKHVAGTVQRLRQAWSHLGAIDRKDKKRLDQEFADALNVLQGPLEVRRKNEAAGRDDLIEQARAINPRDRHALDTLRSLQEQWQEHAKALPLERKTEQALWQRFRAACDAVFAARKESAHAADAERRAHQEAKDAVSARLEAAAQGIEPAAAGKLLRDAAAEWHAIGPVPRANEAKVEKRYHAAVASVQHHADVARRNASLAQAGSLRDKLRLCQALEAELAGGAAIDAEAWRGRWSALPALGADYETVLQARLDAALAAASGSGREEYAALLEQNRGRLLHDILRLEIAAGVDSGAEFARDRLKLQVEVLQTSLKSGRKPVSQAAQFIELCAMPALADARTASRIEQLFTRIAGKEAR